ncbi:endochitinase [Artemisia annua]|uniref:Endochitinase n=1 Tax=Artemisia annua TaxID=35608 RepID=A0A2U1P7Z3_ARTAN|nr:endochitinase [Artemisia annua]
MRTISLLGDLGGWPTAPDGQFAWGYWFVREQDQTNRYCDSNDQGHVPKATLEEDLSKYLRNWLDVYFVGPEESVATAAVGVEVHTWNVLVTKGESKA